MIEALQLVGAILLIGAAIWAGDLIAGGVENALGEKPIRDRAQSNSREG
jgi:outer membrane murein-binding lipoprotein Lpp